MEKKTKKRFIGFGIAVLVCAQLVLMVPQLSIRAAMLFRGHVRESWATEIKLVDFSFLPEATLFPYQYYELNDPPIESEILGFLDIWRVRRIALLWNIPEALTGYILNIDFYDGSMTDGVKDYSIRQFVPQGKSAITNPALCNALDALLIWGYVLEERDYRLAELKANPVATVRINDNADVHLLAVDDRFGYLQIVNDYKALDRVFAIDAAEYEALHSFLENAK